MAKKLVPDSELKNGIQPSATEVVGGLQKADQNTDIAAIPDFVTADVGEGEHLTREDVQIPRLAIAQKMSPEVEEGHVKLIDGLRLGDLFNSLTGYIYGRAPIRFVPVRVENPRWIEFYPRAIGGGVKDLNVPANDPRTQFTLDDDGKSVPPLATKFYDFVVYLPDTNEVVALSMKGTSIKTARNFNGLRMTRVMPLGPAKGRPAPLYAQVYTVAAGPEKNQKGSYFIFLVKNAGWTWALETDFPGITRTVKSYYDNLKNIVLNIDREPGSDDTDFSTDDPSSAAKTAQEM